jgi:hypothetical protein
MKNLVTFKEWIIDLFKDERGQASIKPVIALIGTIFLCVTMTINSLSQKDFNPNAELVYAVTAITIAGMGSDTLDKFSFKRKDNSNQSQQQSQQQNDKQN